MLRTLGLVSLSRFSLLSFGAKNQLEVSTRRLFSSGMILSDKENPSVKVDSREARLTANNDNYDKYPANKLMEQFFEVDKDRQDPRGRAWRASELRTHTMEDLHKLWFVLEKELNMLKTKETAKKEVKDIFLDKSRGKKVKQSMARLKLVIHERQLAYQKAQEILEAEAHPVRRRSRSSASSWKGGFDVEKLPNIIKERIRKFRNDTWKDLPTNIPPVVVNKGSATSNLAQKRA